MMIGLPLVLLLGSFGPTLHAVHLLATWEHKRTTAWWSRARALHLLSIQPASITHFSGFNLTVMACHISEMTQMTLYLSQHS